MTGLTATYLTQVLTNTTLLTAPFVAALEQDFGAAATPPRCLSGNDRPALINSERIL